MNALWQKYADKINALKPRERILVFVAVVAVLLFLLNLLLIDPIMSKQKIYTQQISSQQKETKTIHEQIESMLQASASDPNALARKRAQTQRQIQDIDTQLRTLQNGLVEPGKMANVLEELLKRNGKLELVELKTLTAAPLLEDIAKDKGSAAALDALKDQRLYKHGVEMTVRGGYLDLLSYLAQLERMPWQMLWGKLTMTVEEYPTVTLTFTVYTLSLDETWLVV